MNNCDKNNDLLIKKQQKKIEMLLQQKILKHIINHFKLTEGEHLNTFFYSKKFSDYIKKYETIIRKNWGPHYVLTNCEKKRSVHPEFAIFKMMIRTTKIYKLKYRHTTTKDHKSSLIYYTLIML